ncbi:MAG: CHASE2 domain-containing protein, partial [Cyanobacteria bacterium J06648_10]
MLPGLLVSLSVVALMQIRAWEPVEQLVHNQVVRWRGIHQWDDRLVVVNIDDRSLSQLGQFPISRDYYARLVKQLREKDASVVVFNLILSDETLLVDSQTGQASPETISATAQLAKEMSAHGRVVIGQIWGPEGEVIKPVSLLADMAIATGHMRLPIDTDGYTRFAEITYKDFPALGVAAIQAYSLEDELVSIPTDLQQLRINWPGPVKSLNTVSLIDVLSDNLPPSTLAGKIVIVSYGATSGLSPMRTPFDNRWPVPGGYMHAAVIDNLLNQNWLRSISQTTILLGLLIGGPLFSGLSMTAACIYPPGTGQRLSN